MITACPSRPWISSGLAIALVAAAIGVALAAVAIDAVGLCLAADGPLWSCRLPRAAGLLPQ
jgi:hypothetical protein